jgi:hypothetical protein
LIWTVPNDTLSVRGVSPYLEAGFRFARLREIVSQLHPHQMLHLWPERFLDPQTHLTRESRLPVQQTRQRLPPDAEGFRRLSYGQSERLDHLAADQTADMRRILHRHNFQRLLQ